LLKTLVSMPAVARTPRALKFQVVAATLAASLSCLLPGVSHAVPASSSLQVQLPAGVIEGTSLQAGGTELRAFKGIPYAAPPVGALRWKEPQPVAQWAGVRDATKFKPRCMQFDATQQLRPFRSDGMSEDCLTLNVWTPARAAGEKLPVLVYFPGNVGFADGGSFAMGDGSEPRYDGANLAARGIVTVTVNYRLGVFGFLVLPELARESPYGATGNYGLLDQTAALTWVRENIARFGGDPQQVTIAGQGTGAVSVAAHMVSPLSRGLFARAIGESGAAFNPIRPWSRAKAERTGSQLAESLGANSLQSLRALSADTLLDATSRNAEPIKFSPVIDGHFLRQLPDAVFTAGQQARVPLLIGGNSHDAHHLAMLKGNFAHPWKWRILMSTLFPSSTDQALTFYPGNDKEEVARSAITFANDVHVHNEVWRWMELHRAARLPVYFYQYTHALPSKRTGFPADLTVTSAGASYGAEIEYALANLDLEPSYAWNADDRKVSRTFSGYIEQFIKTGNPNGPQLPDWPAARDDQGGVLRQMIGGNTHTEVAGEAQRQALVQSALAGARDPSDGAFR
jgi:para-nitrobenzyl esterase